MIEIVNDRQNERETLFRSLLYSCTAPAFIWTANGPEVLMMNDNASRLFARCSSKNGTEVDLDSALPGWRDIPEKLNHSIWMNFKFNDGTVQAYQVRNSCLDEDENIWATVLLTGCADAREREIGGASFFGQLETLWTEMGESAGAWREKLPDLTSLIINELGLTGFTFCPSDIFKEFELWQALITPVLEKYDEAMLKQAAAVCERHRGGFVTASSGEEDHDAPSLWGFDIHGEFGGFFILEGMDAHLKEDIAGVCEVLAKKFAGLYDTLSLRRDGEMARLENELNSLVLTNITEGVIVTDSNLSIMYINPIAATMFGFSGTQVVGNKLDQLLVTSDGIQSLIGDGSSAASIKYLHRRSGTLFPCSIKACTMEADGDQFNIFVLSDQTETEEGRLKNEQLTQRAFLGDFASLLAHEIRNPVNNMRIWLANITNLAEGNEAIVSAAERIDGDCERISQLVSNILAFSKPIALNKEEIDLSLFLSEILEKWRLNFARKNITSYFNPPKDFPKFMGDPRTLEQVLNNLIGNSVDALDGHDGVITLKLSMVESETGRRQIMITESDNGPGIPEDKIDHIFEPFMTTKKNGNGWGLAISKRIITSHKGTIRVRSFQGGTVFEILLPAADEIG